MRPNRCDAGATLPGPAFDGRALRSTGRTRGSILPPAGFVRFGARRRSARLAPNVVTLLLLLGSGGPSHAALVINEVLYDPEGPDRGSEWVEIHNTGPWPATLEGVVLESGDGSGPGRWTRTWVGSAGEWIDSGGFCVVGGAWHGRSACSAGVLDLQNGPDGVRLVREGLELDRVGWGDLTEAEYREGAAALAVGSGKSLARRVDGRDTDDNRADFDESPPSPGTWNHPAYDLAVVLSRPGPPVPPAVGPGTFLATARLENRGVEGIPSAAIRLTVEGRPMPIDSVLAGGMLAPGGTVDMEVHLERAGAPGLRSWSCVARCEGDLVTLDDTDTLRLWVGPSPLRLAEIAPRPRPGGTEWVELECAVPSLALAGWSLQDAGGTRLVLRDARSLTRGSRIVVARDSAAARAAAIEPSPWAGLWPTLNDAAVGDEGADTLWLADPSGMITDWAVYGSTGVDESWIRLADAPTDAGLDAWVISEDIPGGSPGEPNPSVPATAAAPDPDDRAAAVSLSRSPGGIWIPVPPAASGTTSVVRLLRLDGTTAGEFRSSSSSASAWARWDGRSPDGRACPAGVYILESRTVGGDGRMRTSRRSLVVGR